VVWLATGFVFPSPRGKLWAIRNFYRNVWTPARQKAGVAFTLYDLRHTFSSRLLAAGIPLIEVSAWMGHGLRAGGHEITNTTPASTRTRPANGVEPRSTSSQC
jgi:integrase